MIIYFVIQQLNIRLTYFNNINNIQLHTLQNAKYRIANVEKYIHRVQYNILNTALVQILDNINA